MPQVGVCRSLHCQFRPVATAGEVQLYTIMIVPQRLERKYVAVGFQPWVGYIKDRHHTVTRSLLDREQVTS